MKVSVIIPVYNIEEYLSRCIDSVLNQNSIEVEVLLVNDGSTDSSGEICDKYAENDERIQVFHQENSGVSSARNQGIRSATSDWICFVDADDWIESNSLASIINIRDNKSTDIIIAKSFKNKDGIPGYEYFPFNRSWEGKVFEGSQLYINKGYGRGSACGVIYSRLFLLENDIFFPPGLKIGEDSIFVSLCFIYAARISFANIHLYNVYEREGSAFRSWTFNKILSMADNIYFIENYISSHPLLDSGAISILNYSKYGVISNIYNYFSNIFSFKNYFKLQKKIRGGLKSRIDTGNIKLNKSKVRVLNFSLDIFAILVFAKNKMTR